jgi:hypothetical protein
MSLIISTSRPNSPLIRSRKKYSLFQEAAQTHLSFDLEKKKSLFQEAAQTHLSFDREKKEQE